MTKEELERLATCAAPARWPAGFPVYQRGAPADGVFVVVAGSIVLRTRLKGGRAFVPAVLGPGEVFGIEGLCQSATYATDARAESEAQTLHLSRERLRTLLRERPADASALLGQVALSHSHALERLRELAMLSVEQRLHAALRRAWGARAADAAGPNSLAFDPAGYRLLCEIVGATRESVSLVVNRLVAEGLAARDGQNLIITDGLASAGSFTPLPNEHSISGDERQVSA